MSSRWNWVSRLHVMLLCHRADGRRVPAHVEPRCSVYISCGCRSVCMTLTSYVRSGLSLRAPSGTHVVVPSRSTTGLAISAPFPAGSGAIQVVLGYSRGCWAYVILRRRCCGRGRRQCWQAATHSLLPPTSPTAASPKYSIVPSSCGQGNRRGTSDRNTWKSPGLDSPLYV